MMGINMKQKQMWCWVILMLLCCGWTQAFGLAELSRQLQSPGNVQGAFVQQRYLKSLTKPLTTEGKFALVPKKALFWHLQKPFVQQLRVRPDGVWQFNGGSWQKTTSHAAGQQRQMQLFLDLLGGNAQGLQNQFETKLSGTAQQWHLVLLPKTALMKQIFSRIDIQGDQAVRMVSILEKQGDKTVMRFVQVRLNVPLSGDAARALAA